MTQLSERQWTEEEEDLLLLSFRLGGRLHPADVERLRDVPDMGPLERADDRSAA